MLQIQNIYSNRFNSLKLCRKLEKKFLSPKLLLQDHDGNQKVKFSDSDKDLHNSEINNQFTISYDVRFLQNNIMFYGRYFL